MRLCDFYKKHENDKVWWTCDLDKFEGEMFSFDKKKLYRVFGDYPRNLSKEEKEIFDAENPEWAEFFGNIEDLKKQQNK